MYPNCRPGKTNPDAPRIRKQFATKGEALAFECFVLDPDKGKPWLEGQGEPTDGRRLSDLVELWFGRHGQSLLDGEARKSKLLTVCHSLGDPLAVNFTARDFAAYCEARLSRSARHQPGEAGGYP